MFKNLLKIFSRKEAERKVVLVKWDSGTEIVTAHKSQSGWVASWLSDRHDNGQWSILLNNGKVKGTTLVKKWYPHSGWDGTETFFEN